MSQVQNNIILRAVAILKEGGVVAYPTDTVYGLGADTFNEQAVLKVFEIKKRPLTQPLPILVANLAQLISLVKEIPPPALTLAQHFLPGGLTLVLPKAPQVFSLITGGTAKVALRIPNHPVPLTLINLLGRPIIGTSANLHGYPQPVTAVEVERQIGDKVNLIIPGKCGGRKASTIIDLTDEQPVVLREGIIPLEEINKVLPMPCRVGK